MAITTFPGWMACASTASAVGEERSGSTNSRSTPTAAGIAQRALDGRIAVGGLVVEEHQVLRVRHLAELDADHVARVSPVLLHRDRLRQGVHGVEDHEIGIAEEGDDRRGLRAILEL